MVRRVRFRKRAAAGAEPRKPSNEVVYDLGLGEQKSFNAATVVFDLCNFTNISRTLTQQNVVDVLRVILGGVAAVVEGDGGTIYGFPGDGVIAVFPETESEAAYNAAAQALECSKHAMSWFYLTKSLHQVKLARPVHRLHLCAGVDYGPAIFSLMGTPDQNQVVLVGDSVNAASKCQQAASPREVVVGSKAFRRAGFDTRWFAGGPRLGVVSAATRPLPYQARRFQWEKMLKAELKPLAALASLPAIGRTRVVPRLGFRRG